MKKLSLVLTITALALPQAGQAGWIRIYGEAGQDEKGYCVQVTNDSNYIVSGYKGNDLWLLKVDTSGKKLWEKTYGGNAGTWVEQTTEGDFIVAGSKLLKTNSQGDSLWMRDIDIYSRCVQQTTDGGYVITGGIGGFPYYLALLKTDSTGDSSWMKTYSLTGWVASNGYFVRQTKDGGYMVTGYLLDTLDGQQRAAFWVFKTDSVGELLWSFTQGGEDWGDWNEGHCVRQTTDNGYMALANFALLKLNTGGDTVWTRNYRNGSRFQEVKNEGYILTGDLEYFASVCNYNPGDIWLLKTDIQGDSSWKQIYTITGESHCVAQTPDKGFIVTGFKYGADLFLIKTDSLGLIGIMENPIVEADYGWNVSHSIGRYVVLHYQGLPLGFQANVFDVSGRQVDQIRGDGNEGAMTWGINQPPGVYFIQALDNQNQLKTAKVVLVR